MSKRKRQKPKLCNSKGCRRLARTGKKICTTCDKRIWRIKYPMKAAFQTLRQNARRREKEFDLTWEQFQQFCYETNYIAGKGRSKKSFTIDREKNHLGYTIDNIRILTKSENSSKADKVLKYDWETKTAIVVTEKRSTNKENPF